MIPADMVPRWRDLPTLAWVAAGGFSPSFGSWTGLAHVAQAAAWPVHLLNLTVAHACRNVAAHHRDAVAVVTPRPTPQRVRRLALNIVLAPLTLTVVLLPTAAIVAAGYGLIAAGLPILGAAALAGGPLLGAIQVALIGANVRRMLSPRAMRELRTARRQVRGRHPRMVEASTLAAAPGTMAGFPLVRRLMRHADAHQIAVFAYAGDDRLADQYRGFGFTPAFDGAHYALYRLPQQTHLDRRAARAR